MNYLSPDMIVNSAIYDRLHPAPSVVPKKIDKVLNNYAGIVETPKEEHLVTTKEQFTLAENEEPGSNIRLIIIIILVCITLYLFMKHELLKLELKLLNRQLRNTFS